MLLDEERVAALRLYFWHHLGVGQTAVQQSQRTPDPEHRIRLERLVAILMPEFFLGEWQHESVERRVGELRNAHPDEEDCRISRREVPAAGRGPYADAADRDTVEGRGRLGPRQRCAGKPPTLRA